MLPSLLQEKVPLPQDSVYVLLPLDAQKEKHFEEKFVKEPDTTFWYQDEKAIVSVGEGGREGGREGGEGGGRWREGGRERLTLPSL